MGTEQGSARIARPVDLRLLSGHHLSSAEAREEEPGSRLAKPAA